MESFGKFWGTVANFALLKSTFFSIWGGTTTNRWPQAPLPPFYLSNENDYHYQLANANDYHYQLVKVRVGGVAPLTLYMVDLIHIYTTI